MTLSDEEARRRGTRKTVLERKAPPTFDVVVEIHDRDRLAIHKNVAEVIDALLRGYQPQPEIRQRQPGGEVTVVQEADTESMPQLAAEPTNAATSPTSANARFRSFPTAFRATRSSARSITCASTRRSRGSWTKPTSCLRSRRSSASNSRNSSRSPPTTCRSTRSRRTRPRRSRAALRDVFNLGSIDHEEIALREAEEAIYQVLLTSQAIELSPQTSYVRRMQHQLAERYRLQSRSTGLEPNRRVRIFKTAE